MSAEPTFSRPASSSPRGQRPVGMFSSALKRSLSRHAGARKTRLALNQLMVFSVDELEGLTAEELQDRLDHLFVSVSHKPVFEPLQRPENKNLLRAFRSGALDWRHVRPLPEAAPRTAEELSRMSLRAALQSLYNRVERTLRPLLLGEARRSSSQRRDQVSRCDVPILVGLEILLQRFLCGETLDWSAEEVGGALLERTAAPPSYGDDTKHHTGGRTHWRYLHLSFTDGTARLFAEALSQLYGLGVVGKRDILPQATAAAEATAPAPVRGRAGAPAPRRVTRIEPSAFLLSLSIPQQRW